MWFSIATAFATQSAPVIDLEGSWSLACTRAEISVHMSLGGVYAGLPGGIDDTLVLPLDCDTTPEDLDLLYQDVRRACRDGGFDATTCRNLAHDVRRTARELSDALAPSAFSLDISEHDLFGTLFGLYPATGTLSFADGHEEVWPYVVDNNDWTRGDYGTLGATIDAGSDTTAQLGCIVLGAATVAGNIDPLALDPRDRISWDLDAVGTLICAADLGSGSWLGGEITVTYAADTEGA